MKLNNFNLNLLKREVSYISLKKTKSKNETKTAKNGSALIYYVLGRNKQANNVVRVSYRKKKKTTKNYSKKKDKMKYQHNFIVRTRMV